MGFRALPEDELERKWKEARQAAERPGYEGRLGLLEFENVKLVNDALRAYDAMTE